MPGNVDDVIELGELSPRGYGGVAEANRKRTRPEQVDALRMIDEGKTDREIADATGYSTQRVGQLRRAHAAKLSVIESLTELMVDENPVSYIYQEETGPSSQAESVSPLYRPEVEVAGVRILGLSVQDVRSSDVPEPMASLIAKGIRNVASGRLYDLAKIGPDALSDLFGVLRYGHAKDDKRWAEVAVWALRCAGDVDAYGRVVSFVTHRRLSMQRDPLANVYNEEWEE